MNDDFDEITNFSERLVDTIINMFPIKMNHLVKDDKRKEGYVKYWQQCFLNKDISLETCEECFKNIKKLDGPPHIYDFLTLSLDSSLVQKIKEYDTKIENFSSIQKPSLEDVSPVFQKQLHEEYLNEKDNLKSLQAEYNAMTFDRQHYKKMHIPQFEKLKYKLIQELKKQEKCLIASNPNKEFCSLEFDYDKRRYIMSLEQTIVVLQYQVNWVQDFICTLNNK